MNEEIKKEINEVDNSKLEKIKLSLEKIENKKSKILFVVPDSTTPVASVYEIYFHATSMKKLGFDVKMLTEKNDYIIPSWIEDELTKIEHTSMEKSNISVGPEDMIIIPEVFSNVMEQIKELTCIKVGFLQSIDYMLNSLIPGMDWSNFNIQNIITTSNTLKDLITNYYGNKFNIKTYNIGIPDYFYRTDKPQRPIISLIGRNPNEISKIVKLFYNKFPQYTFVSFDTMITTSKPPQPLGRKDFAERLRTNIAAVWVDRIASFGTFPLECMKSGCIPIAIKPDITPEYILNEEKNNYAENIGVWTNDIYTLPLLIGDVITKYLDDSITDELYDGMEKIALKYSVNNSEKQVQEAYLSFLEERANNFKNALK